MPPEPNRMTPASIRFRLATAAITSLAVLTSFVGCNKPVTPPKDDARTAESSTDPWGDAERTLQKDTDLATCRTVVAQLNSSLSNPDRDGLKIPPLPGLTPEAEKALSALVPLDPADLEELRPAAFTPLDPVYLANCLYLRDAARSLDAPGLTDARRAELGFAWVCRQVYLNPWLVEPQPGLRIGTALSPTYVLRRGNGSGLERAYVFLALLQQMRLDGCLVGPPSAGDKPAGLVVTGPDGKPTAKGPFWAVGVRVGAEVLLFEPWRGLPIPGPGGKGIATLAQVRANPDQLRGWLDDKSWGVTRDDLKTATAFLAVPISAVAPRWAAAEKQLQSELAVTLAIDPVALRNGFGDLKPAFWNPPGDRFTYGRTLATFLPVEEGGRSKNDPLQLYLLYVQSLTPAGTVALPAGLGQSLRQRLEEQARRQFMAAFFLTDPAPRMLIQRGQFRDAGRELFEKQAAFDLGKQRLRSPDVQEKIRAFCAEAELLSNRIEQSLLENNPTEREAATAAFAQFLQINPDTETLVRDLTTARLGYTEATYLMALKEHEEAERAEVRAELASGADAGQARKDARKAWTEASAAWGAYMADNAAHAKFPGRIAHAHRLAERASIMSVQ